MNQDYSIVQNNFGWNRQADSFWIDQPGIKSAYIVPLCVNILSYWALVGTGYSTAESNGGYGNSTIVTSVKMASLALSA